MGAASRLLAIACLAASAAALSSIPTRRRTPGMAANPPSFSTIKNFRPAVDTLPGVYRSANLDACSEEDAAALLALLGPGGKVVDLRSDDEIVKGRAKRTPGSVALYDALGDRALHRPLLFSDRFWGDMSAQLSPAERVAAELKSIFTRGALDQAMANKLNYGGA